MDTSIRSLLVAAEKTVGQEKNPALQQAYSLLRNVAESKPSVDSPEAFSPDLYVQCAEIAFQNGLVEMTRECLKMYFMKPPPGNQFLCRAYLVQSQLLAPSGTNPDQLEKAVIYLLKAISFAKENPRYHFLVYNASVIYWQFSRPFLKPNFKQYLARSLHAVVKALDDIDDKDYEWRAQLMIALIECQLDAGRKSEASSIAAASTSFIKNNVPQLFKQVFGLIIRNQLIDTTKLHKDIKSSPELGIYYQICKLKVSLENNEPREYHEEIARLLNTMGVARTDSRKKKGMASAGSGTEPDSSLGSLSREVSEMSLPDSAKGRMGKLKNSDLRRALISERTSESLKSPSSTRDVNSPRNSRTPSKQKTGRESDRRSPTKGTGRRTPTPLSTKKISQDSEEMPYLLLELGRLSLELDFPDLAHDCAAHMATCNIKEQGFFLQLEFLQCDITVKQLAGKQESLHKQVVDTRLQAMKRCSEAITNAVRLADPNVIQAGCVTHLLVELRCQVHTELARCEEDEEQIQALSLDDGRVYTERLEVMLHRLELRSSLYNTPERPEDIAGMIIEQARKANSGTMRMKRSLLVKAGEALAPDAFALVLDSESSTKDVSGGKAPMTQIKKLANKARQFTKAALWGDLAKTARKQEVWDVCRVAARFCLLYDDSRWKIEVVEKIDTPKPERTRTQDLSAEGTQSSLDKRGPDGTGGDGSRPSSPGPQTTLYDRDLLRMLAEVNFIQGEAMVHLLRTEGVQLNDQPIPPVDRSKHPKGSFLRGLALGVELTEAWLVCCSATYIWNYNNHVLTQLRHREVMETLTTVETSSLVNICNALAYALMKPWFPTPSKDPTPPATPGLESPTLKKGKDKAQKSKTNTATVAISQDAMPDLKKAIEVLEYVLEVTGGGNQKDVVPILVRMPILQTWVAAKQLAQQQISKNLGVEEELWTQLTFLAYDQHMHNLVLRCSAKALRFAASGTQPKTRKIDGGLLGQSLVDNMGGKNAIRREALSAFLNSARFAMKADNYELVMTAARHYWNACCPLVSQPIERELLREPVRIILQCITETADSKKKEEKTENEDGQSVEAEIGETKSDSGRSAGGIGAVEDDLTLRAALYGVLFQSYADKGQWEAGLLAMDQAITDMPRTKHRLLIFKHRVMTKARLGRSVAMDIQKFKDESEDYVAHMWRRVALMSKETSEQLLSYQNAIEALSSESTTWLKVDLLQEFAQWLCVRDFPVEDAVDQLQWAIDIMINMQAEIDAKKQEELRAAAEAAEAKKASKGVEPANPQLKVEEITDLRILDGLVRSHVLMAEIVGRSSPIYSDCLIMAYTYIMRIWQVTVAVSGPTMKEILKNPPPPPQESGKGSAKKKPDKGAEKAPPVKEKPKRKGPLDVLPHNLDEWAVYDVPDEGYAFHQKACGPIALNELDLAKSRDEIALWREKQSQVAKEEARVREQMAQLAAQDKQSTRASYVSRRTDQTTDDSSTPIDSHLGKVLGAVQFQDIWTETADVLMRQEAQHGQAINFCIRAQALHHGDETYWYETTMLMVDAALQDYESRKRQGVARGILVHALNQFMRIKDERPNRTGVLGYITAMLAAKLAGVQWGIILEDHPDINNPSIMKMVHEICEAAIVLRDAVSAADQVLQDVQTLTSLQEAGDIKIACGELLLEIFRVHARETSALQLEDQRKGSVLKMVEDFIRATPDYTHMEREWVDTVKVVLEEAVSRFLDAHSTAGAGVPRLRCRALCGLGQCLRALSLHTSPDPPTHWLVNDVDLAGVATLELVECFGQYDPAIASQFLALHQSCVTSTRLVDLLSSAQLDPTQSRLAALLRQRANFLSREISSNSLASEAYQSVQAALENDWQSRAKVFGMETTRDVLEALQEKCKNHRHNVQQLLVKQESRRSQVALRDKMLANLDDSLQGQKPKGVIEEGEREERQLQDEFRDLVASLESYLKPITQQLEGVLVPPIGSPSTSTTEKPGREPKEPPPPPQEYVIILADSDLLQLPLEALRVFQADPIVSLSRDFSLQMFHHRYFQDQPPSEGGQAVSNKKGEPPKSAPKSAGKGGHAHPTEDAAAAAKKAKAKTGDNPLSRIPGMRDASKKMAKISVIVDPHLDCAETEENKPIEVFNKVLETYEQQFTPRWLGVMGNEHAPSVGEWEVYLVENSAFIFYGMESFLSYISPAKLSALNIPDCMIVCSLDMAQTTNSFARQSKTDVLKSAKMLALEKPVETAMLTSLAGIKCYLESVRLMCVPNRRKVPEAEESADETKNTSPQPNTDDSATEGSAAESSILSEKNASIDQHETEPHRSWFNLVCYGLPNLVVTQT
ncbi:CFA46-like protein [Mya arenaria]|uniref:CFA46-like protein n=1 Tax=Mya arenaria TaxID=6604 RepID=A0ABY7FI00_MYAAR|nr:CFA46-like protein [Mya arenaria]